MIEGVGLYKTFKDEIDRIGTIKRAWFTTFNLNINFFEQWILPILTKVDFVQAKSLRDFEEMNELLANSEGKEGIDVRIFYDYRAIKNQSETKRTSVSLHAVNSESLTAKGNRSYYKGGVFHPKIGLIQNSEDEYYLLASSANLTLNGWARNRECFFFSRITGVRNARNIGEFFQEIISGFDFSNNNDVIYALLQGSGWGVEPHWRFVSTVTHYFDEELGRQIKYTNNRDVTIWSPYWSLDLKRLISQIKNIGFQKIRLIPAKNDAGKIAITENVFKECSDLDGVSFAEEKWPEERPFIHAKVWMLENTLCIGSWNMTRSGANIQVSIKRNEDVGNNLEAGVFVDINSNEYNQLNKSASFRALNNVLHQTEKEIEKERNEILESFEYPFEVTADWTKGEYELTYPRKIPVEFLKAVVELPDNQKIRLENFTGAIKFSTYGSSLINNRYFSVRLKDKIIFHGFINEVGIENRPINEFDNEVDLLMSWINGDPEDRKDLLKKRISVEEDENIERDNKTDVEFFQIKPWFNNLHGFARIRDKIIEASAQGRQDTRNSALIKIGRLTPGSLAELRAKMIKRIEQYTAIENATKPSPVFLWFMIEETNHCIAEFNKSIRENGIADERIEVMKNIDLLPYLTRQHGQKFTESQITSYLELIRKTIKTGK